MTKFLQPFYLPMTVLFVVILINHMGGNDKAPFLYFAAGLVSLITGIGYLFTLRPFKAMVSFIPLVGLVALFALSRLGFIDLQPILGFR